MGTQGIACSLVGDAGHGILQRGPQHAETFKGGLGLSTTYAHAHTTGAGAALATPSSSSADDDGVWPGARKNSTLRIKLQ